MTRRISTKKGYRWTCPYCGMSRTKVLEGEAAKANAITALQTHIIALDGANHGPIHELPPEIDAEWLANHVERVGSEE